MKRAEGSRATVLIAHDPSACLREAEAASLGLLRAYRAREPWCEGRLIITLHSAFFTPEAWDDIRLKSAETMRAALVGPRPQNVLTPEMF